MVKLSTRRLGKRTAERAEPLLGHFGATLGSLWVYSGDFGSLYDYFGIIVELFLDVIRSDFKTHSFPKWILMILYNSRVTSGLLGSHFGTIFGI